ncbi:MAG: uroporphyrinogen decarboxylase family protein [Armatimonadota bacterium]
MAPMTPRQRVLATFNRRPVDRICFQPRIYYWYNGRIAENTMPEKYRGMSMLEVYDELGAYPRYAPEVLGISVFKKRTDNTVTTHVTERGRDTITVQDTPIGSIREVRRQGHVSSGAYRIEYPVKTPDDMEVMEYILQHTEFYFDRAAFEKASEMFGHRGVVQSFYERSPFQRLMINYMGWENTIFALNDNPERTHEFMHAIERWDDGMYEVICDSPLQIVNFGENLDANIDSPRVFEEYLMPYYNRRIAQLHGAGKFCHIHIDGAMKPLLPLLDSVDFDGIEAATPEPQGDVTLAELEDALGEKILLDGIPAIMFLPEYSDDELIDLATEVLERFSPNLILGVSDEVPPPADIEKVRLVAELVEDFRPPKSLSNQ